MTALQMSPRWAAMSPKDRLVYSFIRACRDSRFKMEPATAAYLTGQMVGLHPLIVVFEIGFDAMARIADGTHPVIYNPKYADVDLDWETRP